MSKINLIQIISHPIQYQSPLYERLAADEDFDFEVFYCLKTDEKKITDTEFGVAIAWDIPLLKGYKYRFLKNYALKESLDSFTGLVNFGIIKALFKAKKNSVIWIHGWNYATLIMALIFGKLLGHRIFFRGDNTAVIENKKPNTFIKRLKTFWLSQFIFKLTDAFLAVGNQNMDYYKLLKVPDYKIVFAPHCVDNQRFIDFKNQNNVVAIRQKLGIPLRKKVIICAGKYIDKKRPLDLLNALILLPNYKNIFVVFVGEGHLRPEMEQFISTHHLQQNVLLTGFINQQLMPHYYLAADLYVMCSGMYETWGLSTNEAMCFGLPVILSDMVGCSYDLIKNNGFMFHSGDYKMLAKQIDLIFSLPENEYQKMRQNSSEIISYYNYENIIKGIKEAAFKETLKPVKVNQFERLFF